MVCLTSSFDLCVCFERRRRPQRDPEPILRLVVTHQGPNEIDAGVGEQVEAIEQFDRQDVARASRRPGTWFDPGPRL